MSVSEIAPYSIIIGVIAAFVVAFTIWSKRRPGSRKPEQAICLSVALLGVAGLCWVSVDLYLAQRETGIPVMKFEIHRLLGLAGVSLLFAAAFWASKAKEREEGQTRKMESPNQPVQHNAGSRPSSSDSSASEIPSSLGPRG